MALLGQTPKSGKTIVIIKRGLIATASDRPIPLNDDPSNPNPISRHPLSGLKWQSKAGVPFRFLRQLRWESAPAVSVAIVTGLAVAVLAVALIDTVTFTAHGPTQSSRSVEFTRFQPTSEPAVSIQGSVEAHAPDTAHSQVPSNDRDSELPEPAFAPIPVVPRRTSIRTVRPKFPDAFRGEVRVHEEPAARSTKDPKPGEQIPDLQVPADALSGTLEQRDRIGQEQKQATDPTRESIPYIVESMSEPSRTPGSD